MHFVETKVTTKMMQVDKNKETSIKNGSEIDKAMELIKALEQKSCEQEDDISELKSDTEAVRMNLSLANNRFKSMKDMVDELQQMIENLKDNSNSAPIVGNSGIDPKQLDKFYASKSKLDELFQRVAVIDNISNTNSKHINDLNGRVVTLEHSDADTKEQLEELWKNLN